MNMISHSLGEVFYLYFYFLGTRCFNLGKRIIAFLLIGKHVVIWTFYRIYVYIFTLPISLFFQIYKCFPPLIYGPTMFDYSLPQVEFVPFSLMLPIKWTQKRKTSTFINSCFFFLVVNSLSFSLSLKLWLFKKKKPSILSYISSHLHIPSNSIINFYEVKIGSATHTSIYIYIYINLMC